MFEKLSFYVVYGTIFVVVNIGVFFAYLDPKIEFYEPKKLGYEYNMLGLISRIIGYQNCVLMHFWGGILCVYENLCKQWINDVKCLLGVDPYGKWLVIYVYMLKTCFVMIALHN